MTDARLTELELKVAHQDKTLEELSDMVANQWKVIDLLKREVLRLNEQVVELGETAKSAGGKEPHY
jgi:SlyX protein